MFSNFNLRRKGFTIIELMIVIAIITILAIVLIPKGSIAKYKSLETGKLVDKRMLQAYVSYKWENILDSCGGDKTLADEMILDVLRSSKDFNNAVCPMYKTIKGVSKCILESTDNTNSYINVLHSSIDYNNLQKDRLYIKDGKVIEIKDSVDIKGSEENKKDTPIIEPTNPKQEKLNKVTGVYRLIIKNFKDYIMKNNTRRWLNEFDSMKIELVKYYGENSVILMNPLDDTQVGVQTDNMTKSGWFSSPTVPADGKSFIHYTSGDDYYRVKDTHLGNITIDTYGVMYIGTGSNTVTIGTVTNGTQYLFDNVDEVLKDIIK